MIQKSQGSIVYFIVGASLLWFIGVIWVFGFNESSLRINIRWSARFSLICFCLAFGATAFENAASNGLSKWILNRRKYLGVSFALIHLIHLFFLFLLHHFFFRLFSIESIFEITLGGIAYLFIVLMMLTSFSLFSQLISKTNWNRLHVVGGYWILIVFSNSILGRVFQGKMEYLPLGLLLIGVWILRIITWKNRERT